MEQPSPFAATTEPSQPRAHAAQQRHHRRAPLTTATQTQRSQRISKCAAERVWPYLGVQALLPTLHPLFSHTHLRVPDTMDGSGQGDAVSAIPSSSRPGSGGGNRQRKVAVLPAVRQRRCWAGLKGTGRASLAFLGSRDRGDITSWESRRVELACPDS